MLGAAAFSVSAGMPYFPQLRMTAVTEAQFPVVRRTIKLADQVALALEAMIAQRQLQAGEKLPPERVLCERFGVSRTAIREAVRSLAAKGLVEVRAGGGTWVRHPSARPAAQLLGLAMQTGGAGVTWANVLEARRTLEVEIAGLAAERHEAADLIPLQEALDDMRGSAHDAEAWARADVCFHDSLAAATHNPLMRMLLAVMSDALLNARRLAHKLGSTPSVALRHHRMVLRHVQLRDVAGARLAMLEHLREAESTLTEARKTAGAGASRNLDEVSSDAASVAPA